MKKVLVISSSLRLRSNSESLADAFARGASEAGNEVEKITIREKRRCVVMHDAPLFCSSLYKSVYFLQAAIIRRFL